MATKVLEKYLTREGPLMSFEIWSRGSDLTCHELELPVSLAPFEYLINRDGLVSDFATQELSNAFDQRLEEIARHDPGYYLRTFAEHVALLGYLEPMTKGEPTLSREGLIELFDGAVQAWKGLLLSFCLPSLERVSAELRNAAMECRKTGEHFFHTYDPIFHRSLQALYPGQALVDLISYDELAREELPIFETRHERAKFYVIASGKLCSGRTLQEFCRNHDVQLNDGLTEADKQATEIRGAIASPGVARGKVRCILRREQIAEFKNGEILVTSMTTPVFLPAMKKASAIVTDEGGITCHAAIVSRELTIPCVIGTRVATQIFQDGDEIEVNADAGIVKILTQVPRVI